jgi:molybdenum cofactor sulfurtransferase
MFGFPTGIGALILKNGKLSNHCEYISHILLILADAASILNKVYFGGGIFISICLDVSFYSFLGTVEGSLYGKRFHKLRSSISSRLEDGTVPFLDIIALDHGFDLLQSLGMKKISR